MVDPKFIEPQSRWVMRTLFNRNLDAFTDEARRNVNWLMLLGDVVLVWLLLTLL